MMTQAHDPRRPPARPELRKLLPATWWLWRLYGCFVCWYLQRVRRLLGRDLCSRIRLWAWNTPKGKALSDCRFRRLVDWLVTMPGLGRCQCCGQDVMHEEPWFQCIEGGTSYIPGEPTVHWYGGWQTCNRCGHVDWVSDSD